MGPPTPHDEAVRIIRDAYDVDCTFFDTAEVYTGTNPDGRTSYNEEMVGQALRGVRGDVVIATKFGVAFGQGMRWWSERAGLTRRHLGRSQWWSLCRRLDPSERPQLRLVREDLFRRRPERPQTRFAPRCAHC